VYEIIEGMYPNYKKIELFAREHQEGWESWGHATTEI
jgi:N6-adenosine-specific RNA methylase IME4